jgi:cytochrome c oxidase cbb3-type subunit 1
MDFTVSVLLGTFILSIGALFAFIWSLSNGLFGDGAAAGSVALGNDPKVVCYSAVN